MAIRSIHDNYECNIAYYTREMKQEADAGPFAGEQI